MTCGSRLTIPWKIQLKLMMECYSHQKKSGNNSRKSKGKKMKEMVDITTAGMLWLPAAAITYPHPSESAQSSFLDLWHRPTSLHCMVQPVMPWTDLLAGVLLAQAACFLIHSQPAAPLLSILAAFSDLTKAVFKAPGNEKCYRITRYFWKKLYFKCPVSSEMQCWRSGSRETAHCFI